MKIEKMVIPYIHSSTEEDRESIIIENLELSTKEFLEILETLKIVTRR